MKKIIMFLSNAFMPDPRPHIEALSLIKAGYEVKILCWDRGEGLPKSEVVDGIKIERIYLRSRHGRGSLQVIFLTILWFKMLLRLIKDDFDIIYCHDFDTLPIGLLSRVLWGGVLLFDSHDVFSKVLSNNVSKHLISFIAFLEKHLIKKADFVVVASPRTALLYRSFGVKKIIVVENWKKIEDFEIEKEYIDKERALLGTEGRLVISYILNLGPDKIIDPLLEVVKEDSSLFLIVAGDYGPQKDILKKASERFNNIVYLGYIPYKKVCLYTAVSDVIFYGMNRNAPMAIFCNPNKLFEALAAGKAFIGGNFGEMGDIIREENCGIALDNFTKDSIKDAIEILRDRNKLEIFKKNAKETALRKYNWANAEKELLRVFSELEAWRGAA